MASIGSYLALRLLSLILVKQSMAFKICSLMWYWIAINYVARSFFGNLKSISLSSSRNSFLISLKILNASSHFSLSYLLSSSSFIMLLRLSISSFSYCSCSSRSFFSFSEALEYPSIVNLFFLRLAISTDFNVICF
jgi:hypothetical protein